MPRTSGLITKRLGWVIAASLLTMPGAAAQTRPLVLQGATLIDGTGASPITDAVVVVEGTRIKAVGKRGQVAIPMGANVIRLDGRTILPGLIDSHVHFQEWEHPMFLHYGVTTIADLNNDTAWIVAQREAVKRGMIKGPRMFVSGTFIWGPLVPRAGGTFSTGPTRTPEEARARVRGLVVAGVDIIKVDLGISDDVLRTVIAEAKAAGRPLLGHTQRIRRAAELGFRHQEHMDTMARSLIDPEGKMAPILYPRTGPVVPPQVAPESLIIPKQLPRLVDYLVKRGVTVNPTFMNDWLAATTRWRDAATAAAGLAKDPQLGFVPAAAKKGWLRSAGEPRKGYDNVVAYLRQYSQAGGKVVIGTDAGFNDLPIAGLSVHQEMQIFADIGIPPMKVIQGATLWNAELIGQGKDLGSVEPGKLADFTIIEGNPLADISATRNVRMVIKDGAVVDTRYDPKWVNPIPQPYSSYFKEPPLIAKVSPVSARQDGQSVTLEIVGTNFTPDAVARFGNADLPTHFVSATKLTATLGAQFLRKLGSYPVYIVGPGPHGYVSAAYYFLVDDRNSVR